MYMNVSPTVVLWDGRAEPSPEPLNREPEEDDIWDEMEGAESDEEGTSMKKSRTK